MYHEYSLLTALSGDGPTNVSHHKTYGVPHVASINLFVIQYGNTNNHRRVVLDLFNQCLYMV